MSRATQAVWSPETTFFFFLRNTKTQLAYIGSAAKLLICFFSSVTCSVETQIWLFPLSQAAWFERV